MAQTSFLATAIMKSMAWLRGAIQVDASTYEPSERAVSAMDAVASSLIPTQPLNATTIESIWETKTLTGGVLLGLFIIFAVSYIRSPWRKLPPGPRRLPILGNALQLRDKSWLFSKDCKERFGEFMNRLYREMLRSVYGNCRRGYVP